MSEPDSAGLPDLRDQVAGLTFALVLLAPDLSIVQVNPAAENLIGRSARRLVGRKFLDVVEFAELPTSATSSSDKLAMSPLPPARIAPPLEPVTFPPVSVTRDRSSVAPAPTSNSRE